MDVNLHLQFAGDCRAAFAFYEKLLSGIVEMTMTYGESPMAAECDPGMNDLILHTSMTIGNMRLMGCDMPPDRFTKATGFSLSLNPKTAAEAAAQFAALSEGGQVLMPLQATFWTPAFGETVDRFGIPWTVSADGPQG